MDTPILDTASQTPNPKELVAFEELRAAGFNATSLPKEEFLLAVKYIISQNPKEHSRFDGIRLATEISLYNVQSEREEGARNEFYESTDELTKTDDPDAIDIIRKGLEHDTAIAEAVVAERNTDSEGPIHFYVSYLWKDQLAVDEMTDEELGNGEMTEEFLSASIRESLQKDASSFESARFVDAYILEGTKLVYQFSKYEFGNEVSERPDVYDPRLAFEGVSEKVRSLVEAQLPRDFLVKNR